MRVLGIPGILINLWLLVLLASCGSCAGNEVPDENGTEQSTGTVNSELETGLSNRLPAPSKITAAYQDYQSCFGDAYVTNQYQNVSPGSDNVAEFAPDCDPQQPEFDGVAWAIYAFTGAQAGGYITLNWPQTANDFHCYVGVSDFSRNAWTWCELPGSHIMVGSPNASQLNGGDKLLLAISITGTEMSTLASITLSSDVVGGPNLFFLHHSTGQGIINGGVRDYIADYNTAHSTSFEFWDHGYNGDGLHDADGDSAGCYNIPNDNTDPDGLYYLWTSTEADATACRDDILANHDVIAFKSCYPASAIGSAEELQQYKDWYTGMLAYFDAHLDHVFVVMSTPPLHRLSTNADDAARARQFANWLKSDAYLDGHPNVVCYDLFDALAQADDGSASANMLRYDYEGSHDDSDSHPNSTANATVAPLFAQALIDASLGYDWPE